MMMNQDCVSEPTNIDLALIANVSTVDQHNEINGMPLQKTQACG